MKLLAALIALPLVLGQQPARDATTRITTGTASIAGTVVMDDRIRQPIRRVQVVLTSTDGATRLSETTDDSGTFGFRGLSPGRYSLSASKPAWLTTNFGATRPTRPGTPIAVADGARLTGITLRMARGAVITGVVRDPSGQPAPGVRMHVSRLSTRNGERYLDGVPASGANETDDTGTFRIFGLPPGDFIVSAVQDSMVSSRDDAGSFLLATPGPPVKLAMVFYPGTTDPNSATVLALTPGDERSGIDITLQFVPTSSIDGIVTDAAGVPQRRITVVAVSGGIQLGDLMGLNGVTTASTDNAGRYQLMGLAPGEYMLLASAADEKWAEAGVAVNGRDVTVPLTVQPFLTIAGRVVFDGAVPPPSGSVLNYSMNVTGTFGSLMARASSGTVTNGIFESSVVPGKYQLVFRNLPAGWYPKSAIARGQDTFDMPVVIGPRDQLTDFVVTFTDKPSELTGSLVDATGRPAPDYFVVVFSSDRRFWTQSSRRVAQIRPGSDGAFALKGLPAGDYYIAALTDIEPGESLTAEFLDSIVASSPPVQIKIVDGQRTVQPLKLGGG